MRFKIYASEVVYYVAEVDADSESEALDKAIEFNDWNACDSNGWAIDKVIIESEDE